MEKEVQDYLDDTTSEYRNTIYGIAETLGKMIASEQFDDSYLFFSRDWLKENYVNVRQILDAIREEDDIDWTYTESLSWIKHAMAELHATCETVIDRQILD